jgi:hypothetical protein
MGEIMRALTLGLTAAISFATCTAAEANVGSWAYNRELSQRRAEAVKAEMIRLGLSEDMIVIVGRTFDGPPDDTVSPSKDRPVIIEMGY